jgi:hypothetical protein
MKTLSGKFFTLFIVLIGTCDIYAGKGSGAGPPAPTGKQPPPPGVPIDENVFILFGVAIVFAIYIIYRDNLKTKKPI